VVPLVWRGYAPDVVLHARWQAEVAGLGWTGDRLWQAVTAAASRIRAQEPPARSTGAVLVDAVTAAGRARATFSRADLAAEIARRLPAARITAEQLRATVEHLTDTALARGGAILLGAPSAGRPPAAPIPATPPRNCSPPKHASSTEPSTANTPATVSLTPTLSGTTSINPDWMPTRPPR
jgi:hypothetical protein